MPIPARPWRMAVKTVRQDWRLQSRFSAGGACVTELSLSLPPAARFAQGPLSPLHASFLSLRLLADTTVGKPEHQRAAQAAEGDFVA